MGNNKLRPWRGYKLLMFLAAAILLPAAVRCETVEIDAAAGTFEIKTDAGISLISMPGFPNAGSSGNPQLPAKFYEVALPPDTDMSTVKVAVSDVITEELPRTYDIKPVPPAAANIDGKTTVYWGTGKNIKEGRNLNVYGQDAKFPDMVASLDTTAQMRKWKFARVQFNPVQYNPVSGKLYLIRSAVISVSAGTTARAALSTAERAKADVLSSDTAMDDLAAGKFVNFAQAKAWHDTAARNRGALKAVAVSDYAIITTNAIQTNSTKLAAFVTQLTALGHTPLVVTETDYGSLTGQSPNGTSEKIRKWLIDNYAARKIVYVLLIGDPTPLTGDVPMKMCWPRSDQTTEQQSPTDYFYGNLSGNWDLNANGKFGEYVGDQGTGGVDFTPELYVGRIPVYSSNYAALDRILQRIMDYKSVTGEPAWRKKALLPMAISNYANEDNVSSARSDGLNLPQHAIENFLAPNGFSNFVMYEKQGLLPVPSTAAYDNAAHIGVSEANMINEWNRGYGIVLWWGHGSATAVARKYWNVDSAGNGIPLAADMLWPDLFTSVSAASLTDTYPSLVFQVSCNNGYPETTNNLAYSLLYNGAVTTVAASRVSWYAVGTWDPANASTGDNASTGFYYFKRLLSTATPTTAGQALYTANTTDLGNGFSGSSWMNKMDFNIYGDPSITLFGGVKSTLAPSIDKISYGSLSASWQDIPGASYTIALSTDAQFTGIVAGSSDTVTGNAVSYANLMPNTTYWFEVKLSTETDAAYYFNRVSAATPINTLISNARVYPIPWLRGKEGKFDSATVPGCGTGLIFDNMGSDATIRIYNVQGDLVREMNVSSADRGCKAWDGKNGSGREVASGVYIAYINSAGNDKTFKLVVER